MSEIDQEKELSDELSKILQEIIRIMINSNIKFKLTVQEE